MKSPVSFGDRLTEACIQKSSFVCVGLDPRWKMLPDTIRSGVDDKDLRAVAGATCCYCREVIDAVAHMCPIVKPQAAFFEQLGPHGMLALGDVIHYAREAGLLVLLDAKRGDIGSTAEGYANAYLGEDSPWQCDALTVNPYLGDDTLEPFVRRAGESGTGIFVLVKTSNPGSGFIQDQISDRRSISRRVADFVQQQSQAAQGQSSYGHVGAVVGATYPDQLAEMRAEMPNAWLLIPGFGAQGGTAEDVRQGFRQRSGGVVDGAVVNSSRGIIFAYEKESQPSSQPTAWQEAVARAAETMRQQLNQAVA